MASDVLTDVPTTIIAYFNAPKYKANVSIGNVAFGPKKRLGANLAYRWAQGFYYQADFVLYQLSFICAQGFGPGSVVEDLPSSPAKPSRT